MSAAAEPLPGSAAAAAAEDAEAASAADSISVADAEDEAGYVPLTDDGCAELHQPTGNLDLTDAAISQEVQLDAAAGGGALPAALPRCCWGAGNRRPLKSAGMLAASVEWTVSSAASPLHCVLQVHPPNLRAADAAAPCPGTCAPQ